MLYTYNWQKDTSLHRYIVLSFQSNDTGTDANLSNHLVQMRKQSAGLYLRTIKQVRILWFTTFKVTLLLSVTQNLWYVRQILFIKITHFYKNLQLVRSQHLISQPSEWSCLHYSNLCSQLSIYHFNLILVANRWSSLTNISTQVATYYPTQYYIVHELYWKTIPPTHNYTDLLFNLYTEIWGKNCQILTKLCSCIRGEGCWAGLVYECSGCTRLYGP